MGWIVVELAIVREFSVLQVVYVAIGAAFAAVGRSGRSELVDRARTRRVECLR